MVHWRREWQTTSVFLALSPVNSMKRQKDSFCPAVNYNSLEKLRSSPAISFSVGKMGGLEEEKCISEGLSSSQVLKFCIIVECLLYTIPFWY